MVEYSKILARPFVKKLFCVCGKTVDHKNKQALFKVAGLKHGITELPSHLSELTVMKENLSEFACKVHVGIVIRFLESY